MKNENCFDKFLLGLWVAASLFFRLAFKALSLFVLGVRFLVLLPFRHGERKKPDDKRIKSDGLFANLAKRVDARMRESKGLRRAAFVVFVLFAAYCAYPPSHWGPWYRYQTGVASYYGPGFWFNRTANGDIFIPLFMTAAHKTLPLGTFVKVVNVETGKCVYVTINDRGPFVKNRIIDLSSFAGWRLGIRHKGTGKVLIYTKKLNSSLKKVGF